MSTDGRYATSGLVPGDLPSGRSRSSASELYRSAIRHPSLDTPRGRALTSFQNFFLHLYPVKVPRRSSCRRGRRCGSGSSRRCSVRDPVRLRDVPDVLLHPAPPDAYFDMHALATAVAFGQFVRNVHRWSAHLMVLVVFLHLLRVFYAGAYKRAAAVQLGHRRRPALLTLLLSFTGYLLPWDQLSYWAITVGTNIASYVPVFGDQVRNAPARRQRGRERHAAALLRPARLLHPAPLMMLVLAHPHLAGAQGRLRGRRPQDRRDRAEATRRRAGGGSAMPTPEPRAGYRLLGVVQREIEHREEQEPDDDVFTWPHLLVRHVVVAGGHDRGRVRARDLVRRAAEGHRQPQPDAGGSEGALVLRRAAGAARHLQPMVAGRDRPGAPRCSGCSSCPTWTGARGGGSATGRSSSSCSPRSPSPRWC